MACSEQVAGLALSGEGRGLIPSPAAGAKDRAGHRAGFSKDLLTAHLRREQEVQALWREAQRFSLFIGALVLKSLTPSSHTQSWESEMQGGTYTGPTRRNLRGEWVGGRVGKRAERVKVGHPT